MNRADVEGLDKAALVDLVLLLSERLAQLEQRFEELERRAARGAAPFARPRDKRSPSPKPPGRRGGHDGCFRMRPPDALIDERVEVELTHCPRCGEALSAETDEIVEQTLIEAPEPRAQVIRLMTHRNWCCGCQAGVASTHPLQVSGATGAAGTHLGPRALAVAASLNKGLGLTMRTTCRVLRDLAGITLTPGGLSQAMTRVAGRLAPAYDALLTAIRAEPVLHTDETSWWVGGRGASLWVLTNEAGTAYHIVDSRSRAEAEALLGGYQGVLVSDCLNLYDDLTPRQHKCYAHHLKEIGKALEDPRARGSPYLAALRGLLQGAMALKTMKASLREGMAASMRQALDANAERLLASPRTLAVSGPAAPVEERVRMRLRKQQDHLFTFLDHDAVEATNNRAERSLRPAVISRKLSCGNKTAQGAQAWEIIASLAATCRQANSDFVDLVIPNLALSPHSAQAR